MIETIIIGMFCAGLLFTISFISILYIIERDK